MLIVEGETEEDREGQTERDRDGQTEGDRDGRTEGGREWQTEGDIKRRNRDIETGQIESETDRLYTIYIVNTNTGGGDREGQTEGDIKRPYSETDRQTLHNIHIE